MDILEIHLQHVTQYVMSLNNHRIHAYPHRAARMQTVRLSTKVQHVHVYHHTLEHHQIVVPSVQSIQNVRQIELV